MDRRTKSNRKTYSNRHESNGRRALLERKQKSLFYAHPHHPQYAVMFHLRTPSEAHKSVAEAKSEFKRAGENGHRQAQYIIKMETLHAANMAEAMSENHRLSTEERERFRHIHAIYQDAYQDMHLPERKHHYEHAERERHGKHRFPMYPHAGEQHIIYNKFGNKQTWEATGHSGHVRGHPKWVRVPNT